LSRRRAGACNSRLASGCLILVIEPQPTSGSLEQDARAAFDLMYRGWAYQKAGEHAYVLSKGRTAQGLDYTSMEAAMSATTADGRYHLEEGLAVVILAGTSIVIVAARHNSSMLGHDRCTTYEGWPRFFFELHREQRDATGPDRRPGHANHRALDDD
jgi:hypothetical protein